MSVDIKTLKELIALANRGSTTAHNAAWVSMPALIEEVENLRAQVAASEFCAKVAAEKNTHVNSKLEGLLARLDDAEADLRALRAVPTPDASGVCVDDGCPFPEHTGDCPPASSQQWEHLARLRGRHIEACHRRMMTARDERDAAVRTIQGLQGIKRSYEGQLAAVQAAEELLRENLESELEQVRSELVAEHARCLRLEKQRWATKEDCDHYARSLSKERDISEALARKLDAIRGLLK